MNEWGFIGQDILVGSDSCRKENTPQVLILNQGVTAWMTPVGQGYVRDESLVLLNPHSS